MDKKWDKNLKIYVINGILYSVMFNLYSPFAAKFLERLGGSEFHMSLFNALPGLVAVFATLPGTLVVIRSQNKKVITALFFLLSRLFLLALAFVPASPTYLAPIIYIVLMSLRNFPESVSQTAFQSFSGDLFTPEKRSTAITLRSRFSIPATLLVTLAAGQILSRLPSTETQVIQIYQLFFIIAFVVGLAETVVFLLIREPQGTNIENLQIKNTIMNALKNKNFINFTKTSLLFYFAWQMGWPLFNIFHVITLRADEWWLSAISIASFIGMFSGYSFWNKLIKEKGNRFVTRISTMGIAINPLFMVIAPNLYIVTFINLLIGFFIAGAQTVLLNYLLEVTPDENRVIYVGIYNTLTNLTLAISPFVAHAVLSHSDIYIALIVVAVLRFIGSILFFTRDPKTSQLSA